MIPKKTLETLYLDEKLSMRKIARRFGTYPQAIHRLMRQHGIPSRTCSEAGKVREWPPELRVKVTASARACKGEGRPNWKPEGTKRKQRGYIVVKVLGHPRGLWVFEHILVMERHLGRYLRDKEEIHHINHDKEDNRLENLRLFSSHSEHLLVCRPHERRDNG